MSYITMRDLSIGADFGAQMMATAGLYSVTKTAPHTPIIITERYNEGYKIRLTPEIFPNFFNIFQHTNFMDHKWEWVNFKNMLCDKDIYNNLDPNINYNFPVKFMTYHYWMGLEDEIRKLFEFGPGIKKLTEDFRNAVKNWSGGKEIIAVHFRRGDYLTLASLNLSMNYYYEALKHFDPNKCCLLLFSNSNQDIEWLRDNFKPGSEWQIYETDHNYPLRLDMALMSLCDHNIIANSSYSWWGAWLNENKNKKVICPYNYLDVPWLNHINGNYYPETWMAIKTI